MFTTIRKHPKAVQYNGPPQISIHHTSEIVAALNARFGAFRDPFRRNDALSTIHSARKTQLTALHHLLRRHTKTVTRCAGSSDFDQQGYECLRTPEGPFYLCNPDKTDEMFYVFSFACSRETAALDFKYTLDHTNDLRGQNAQYNENKAFHLIQAFAPGEISYEEAHTIGNELAERLLPEKYAYVLTTHIDNGYIHNHLIFYAADNLEHNHYYDNTKGYYHIRDRTDELCREHNLSVIEPESRCDKKHNEWQTEKDGNDWKNQTRKDINIRICAAKSQQSVSANDGNQNFRAEARRTFRNHQVC